MIYTKIKVLTGNSILSFLHDVWHFGILLVHMWRVFQQLLRVSYPDPSAAPRALGSFIMCSYFCPPGTVINLVCFFFWNKPPIANEVRV